MSSESILISKHIEKRIFTIRGKQIMIDRDLAELYQVETKVLNQAVKRNIDRFPEVFRFQLTEEETLELTTTIERFGFVGSRSHFVTLNKKRGQNIKYLPYAYTEQGVAMLSAILRSDVAIEISIQIMNAFVELRKIITQNQGLLQRMDLIERRQIEADNRFEQIFKALESKDTIPNQGVFFEDQVFDAYELTSKLIRSAKESIILIDNYIDENTLTQLSKKNKKVKVTLFTKKVSQQLHLDLKKANEQYGNFEVNEFHKSHDRFLILDNTEIYHLGASLKDLGKKWFAFSKMDKNSVSSILNEIIN